MPKSLIVYFSQGGTTARVAESIAKGLHTQDYQVDLCRVQDNPPELTGYNLLGIGTPAYYYNPPFTMVDYVKNLPELQELPVFVFVVYGTYRGGTCTLIRNILMRKKGKEVGYFHCYGADYFLGYLNEGYLFSPDHPTCEELNSAEAFGKEIAARCSGKEYTNQKEDPISLLYQVERLLMNRFLVNHILTQLFTVDKKTCTKCDICIELCPTKNVTKDEKGFPTWGRHCLLCFSCQMKCPEDAIGSLLDWAKQPLFRVLVRRNIDKALKDPSIDHVKVIHSHGCTKRIKD